MMPRSRKAEADSLTADRWRSNHLRDELVCELGAIRFGTLGDKEQPPGEPLHRRMKAVTQRRLCELARMTRWE